MSNLVDYAKDELKRIGMIDSGEEYNDWASKAILDLIELFSSQNHSGFSASYVVNAFSRLAMFKPLSPLTGEDDEWSDAGGGSLQNKRYSAVFKDKDGIAYNIEGKVFTDDGGETWYACKDSRVNVTFPYVVPDKPEYVYRKQDTAYECGKHANEFQREMRDAAPMVKQEPCEDCISRQAVLALAKEECDAAIIPYRKFVKGINALLPVTPKPKTGHWIKHEHNGITHIECSECFSWFLSSHLLRNSYCPNCGARMESED